MRICFFGAWDPGYPRNRILREGLRRAGHEVIEARVIEKRAIFRYPALAAAFARVAARSDVIFVPEFRHKDVPLARALAGRRPLIFDPLVSRVDTLVEDWGIHARGSMQARWNAWIDRVSFTSPDLVLCDTWAHGRLFGRLGVPPSRLARVPVGAEDAFFAVEPRAAGREVRIGYLGGFLPLHGATTVVEALALIERRSPMLEYRAVLAGRGIEWETCKRGVAEMGLKRVEFPGPIPYDAAPRFFADSDIVLGAFGAGEKAGRVVPHKVWQGLAAGRAVVTGDGEGMREWLVPGVHVEAPPRGNAAALADALERTIVDRARRESLAAAGRARALEVATPDRVAADLQVALEGLRR